MVYAPSELWDGVSMVYAPAKHWDGVSGCAARRQNVASRRGHPVHGGELKAKELSEKHRIGSRMLWVPSFQGMY